MSSYLGFRIFQVANYSRVPSSIIRRLSSRTTDNSWISTPAVPSSHDEDILLKSIKSSKETSDVLHYISKHHTIMNRAHILQAFRIIFSIQKSERPSMSNGEITHSNQFKTLCNVLKSRVRSLDINETLDVLKTLSYLGVPASSKLMSILLNIIANRVNELSLHQIIFLDFLMKDFNSIPIVEALKLALPVVFQANLSLKIDRSNVKQACDLLYYVTKKKLPTETVDSLVDIITSLREELDLESAMSVIKSISSFDGCDESYRPLIYHAFDVVLSHINECSFNDLDIIMTKCMAKYSKDTYFFYHEEFFNSVANFVVRNDSGFEEGIWILKKLNKVGHIDIKLLDYLAKKAEIELTSPRGLKANVLYTLVRGFSTPDYRPPNWSTLEPIVIQIAEAMFEDKKGDHWFSFIRDLCALGSWPLSIIEKIFETKFLESYMKAHSKVMDQLQLLSLYQEVSTLCPDHFKPSPPKEIIDRIIDINGKNIDDFPLLNFLERGLGGSSFVATGVYTGLGHFLHHLIVLRKGGFPSPLASGSRGNSRVYMDDFKIPQDHHPVVIMYLPPSFYCSNVDSLKGHAQLSINSITALGLTVVPISSNRWEALLEHEKTPYLMREINEKCESTDLETVKS